MNDTLNLEPLTDKILLEPVEVERSAGGVWLPGTAKNGSFRGKVVAIGPKCDFSTRFKDLFDEIRANLQTFKMSEEALDRLAVEFGRIPNISIGDTLIYRSWAGSALCQETIFGGKKLLVVEPADVLAKVL